MFSSTSEVFSLSAEELIGQTIHEKWGAKNPAAMPVQVRRAIIAKLNELDVFRVKGTIPFTAQMTGVSEQTIYRHINEAEKKGSGKDGKNNSN